MKRRAITLPLLGLATAALLAPSAVRGQATTRTRARVTLFFFGEGDVIEAEQEYRALLAKEGFEEPRNLTIEVATARTHGEVEARVHDVVRKRPDLVLLGWRGGPSAHAFQAATNDIPIVFTGAGDPVRSGLVESLRRPGRNITGSSGQHGELVLKRLELFKELRPDYPRLAVLVEKSATPSGRRPRSNWR